MDPGNRMENVEIDPHKYALLIFDRDEEHPNGISKDSLFNKWCHRKLESIGEIFSL